VRLEAVIKFDGVKLYVEKVSISGNKVKINGIDYIADGFTITSRKGSSASPATDTPTTTAASSGRRVARNDSSLWVWTGVGCTTLAALTLGGLTTFRTTRKKTRHHSNNKLK